jgi:hypothetical protein
LEIINSDDLLSQFVIEPAHDLIERLVKCYLLLFFYLTHFLDLRLLLVAFLLDNDLTSRALIVLSKVCSSGGC